MENTLESKKMINSVERCVDDNLEGYVALNPGVRLLKDHRIVIRADLKEYCRSGKVAVVGGGGSGHEPAHAGYVGRGFLTAAVCGAVFASPPPQEILYAIRAVATHNSGGCLLSVANYTGDRLNFGLALEKAKQEGLKVEMIVTGEDCALTSHDRTAGRRGLVGYAVINKIAGALAEMGKSLADIVEVTTAAMKVMGTIGVSWRVCSVPGSGPTFSLARDEMELGLGVHGEAGVKRLKMMNAKETVKTMMEHMTDINNSTHLQIKKGDSVAVFVNNLGSTTTLEMNIIVKEVISYLEERGIIAPRVYCSPFKTALEMAGTSITILHLNATLLESLDLLTESPHWPRPLLPRGETTRRTPSPMVLDYVKDESDVILQEGCVVDKQYADVLYSAVRNVCGRLIENEAGLNLLDTEGGDGDTGSTLARGARVMLVKLGSREFPGLPTTRPYDFGTALGKIAENEMGGASGALHSLLLTSTASSLKQEVTFSTWTNGLASAIETIKRYGGAQPGDRTMLDPLCAASKVFTESLQVGFTMQVFRDAVKGAEDAATATSDMPARAGRASYVNPDRLKQPDPGAMGVVIWMKSILEVLEKN